MGKDSKDKKAKNVPKHVELRAAVALLHDTDKSGKVETALQLLHAVISSTGGPYLGLAVADASSIKVTLDFVKKMLQRAPTHAVAFATSISIFYDI